MDEEAILSFLTDNAQLSDIVTRQQFIAIFPKDKRADPAVESLYQDLAETRARQVNSVRKNVRLECAVSSRSMQVDLDNELGDSPEVVDGENEIENIYSEIIPPRVPHKSTLTEMVSRMQDAVSNLAAELDFIGQDSKRMIEETGAIVDSLSDLRYKKLSAGSVEQCLSGLVDLYSALPGSHTAT
ncbi:hypothetical protein POJ06DRAFT_284082 [Lipomyces tetrasporus]|uniref:Uncharacterized protein n=1 Tax=Lipomyces tetrasporus TaxID=54092 RepID=A0AAD7VP20_9ASCO|nr:uncharacterized protein POJ06DRAFT_284082 [Lipomyces tetrasporus]KAJ8096503.1 hypothetical protein POJ06DRAFT_284082 [Lipomyces tetrasporus]